MSTSLAVRERFFEGRHCSKFEGQLFYDDAIAVLSLTEMLEDKEAAPERSYLMQQIMMCEPEELTLEVLNICVRAAWDLYGIDLTGEHADDCGGKRVIDWKSDVDYIKASLMSGYGITWADASTKLSYADLVSLIGLAPHETPMGQAVYYRTAKCPKETKFNSDLVKDFKERQAFWRIDKRTSVHRANAETTNMFDSLRRMAARSNDG